jgi:PAS domain S-box-containing protein
LYVLLKIMRNSAQSKPDQGANLPDSRLDSLPIALIEMLFDCTPDIMFFIKDATGRYASVNAHTVRQSGKRHKTDLIGKRVSEVYPRPYSETVYLQDAAVLERGIEIRDQLELYLSPQGAPRWCLTHKFPLRNERGEISGVIGISRDLPHPNERHTMYARIAKPVQHLQEHFAENLRIPDLARMAGYSSDQFERAIRAVFQLTPKQLLVKIRLEAASQLLKTTDLSVSEIAHRCGYTDHSAFTRVFKRVVSVTPQQFRHLLRDMNRN